MGYASERAKREFTLPSGYKVSLWEELTYGDIKRIGQMGEQSQNDQADTMLLTMLASWNLTDAEENLLEINESNLNLLKKDDAEAMITEVGKVLEEGNQEKKASSSLPSLPSTEPDQPLPNS